MGCFDFTYADNGDNIRSHHGYIYLSPQIAEEADLPNPLPYSDRDSYGQCSIHIFDHQKDIYYTDINVYALYAVLIQTENNKRTADADQFISLLRHRQFDDEYKRLNDSLRSEGIDCFFHNLKHHVSAHDPKQSLAPTHNLYCKYII